MIEITCVGRGQGTGKEVTQVYLASQKSNMIPIVTKGSKGIGV